MQNKFSVKVGNLAQEGGGGLTQSQLLQITVFMAYLTLFWPKISEKFTEKIPTFGEGGVGQAVWAKFPTFTENLFWVLPLWDSRITCLRSLTKSECTHHIFSMTKDDILESLLILQAIHLELINFSDSIPVNSL